jgi:HK97 family phage prohead protease
MSEILIRRFAADFATAEDGRNIIGRCVPYDVAAKVTDRPGQAPYVEVYRHGAFARAVKAPHRVLLNYEHGEGLGNIIGHAEQLDERPDGLWASFRALDGPQGDTGLALVRNKSATGLSVGIVPDRRLTRTLSDGTVERMGVARLVHVALTSVPSFASAGVVDVRSSDVDEPEPVPRAGSPEAMLDRIAAMRASYER